MLKLADCLPVKDSWCLMWWDGHICVYITTFTSRLKIHLLNQSNLFNKLEIARWQPGKSDIYRFDRCHLFQDKPILFKVSVGFFRRYELLGRWCSRFCQFIYIFLSFGSWKGFLTLIIRIDQSEARAGLN